MGHGLAIDAVAFVLEPVDLHPTALETGKSPEPQRRLVDLRAGSEEDVGLLAHLVERLFDVVQDQ